MKEGKKSFFGEKVGFHRYTENILEKEIFCYQRVYVLIKSGWRVESFDGE